MTVVSAPAAAGVTVRNTENVEGAEELPEPYPSISSSIKDLFVPGKITAESEIPEVKPPATAIRPAGVKTGKLKL